LPVVVMLTICAFFALALGWSFFGRLDIHAVAAGKIETAGRAKVIQPLDPGKVLAIHVESGAHVRAGDLVLELDPAEAAADEAAQRDAFDASVAEATRRRFAITQARAAMALLTNSGDARAGEAIALLEGAALDADPKINWDSETTEKAKTPEVAVLLSDLNQLLGPLPNTGKA